MRASKRGARNRPQARASWRSSDSSMGRRMRRGGRSAKVAGDENGSGRGAGELLRGAAQDVAEPAVVAVLADDDQVGAGGLGGLGDAVGGAPFEDPGAGASAVEAVGEFAQAVFRAVAGAVAELRRGREQGCEESGGRRDLERVDEDQLGIGREVGGGPAGRRLRRLAEVHADHDLFEFHGAGSWVWAPPRHRPARGPYRCRIDGRPQHRHHASRARRAYLVAERLRGRRWRGSGRRNRPAIGSGNASARAPSVLAPHLRRFLPASSAGRRRWTRCASGSRGSARGATVHGRRMANPRDHRRARMCGGDVGRAAARLPETRFFLPRPVTRSKFLVSVPRRRAPEARSRDAASRFAHVPTLRHRGPGLPDNGELSCSRRVATGARDRHAPGREPNGKGQLPPGRRRVEPGQPPARRWPLLGRTTVCNGEGRHGRETGVPRPKTE